MKLIYPVKIIISFVLNGVLLAKLLGNDLHLLPEIIFPLRLVNFLPELVLNLLFDAQYLCLTGEHSKEHSKLYMQPVCFKELLLFGNWQGHTYGDIVKNAFGVIAADY